jgi:hypothetical protein
MGELQTRAADGSWRTPLLERSATEELRGLPVASLAALEQFYVELGRTERVELVRTLGR